jgi:predicted molibdopterin-dependent oxidoreductase YjgC
MIVFFFDGESLEAREGQTLAAALLANHERITRLTRGKSKPRGIFCGIGACFDCLVIVNGESNQRSCLVEVCDGMQVKIQDGA